MMSACAVGARSPVARLPRSVGSTRAGRRACVDVRGSNAPKPGAKNKKVRRAFPDRAHSGWLRAPKAKFPAPNNNGDPS
jgi:hypothetical protein